MAQESVFCHCNRNEDAMNMLRALLLVLLALPVLELYLLIHVGGLLGFLPTLALLIGAAALGSYMLQTQGISTWQRVQQSFLRGELPAGELMDGFFIMLGGGLLLLPGFLSDIAGLLCLLPPTRRLLAVWLLRNQTLVKPGGSAETQAPRTIEGEFKRED
jgi:UPF0716 protein FxsA